MPRKPQLGFVLICILLDALGIGLIVPVLPRLIGTLTDSAGAQTTWYGAMMLSYGVMQFVSAPVLGALSDRIGRRPILLAGIFGLGVTFAVPAFCDDLVLILLSRITGGMLSANVAVAQAYIADVTPAHERSAAFGRIGAVFGIGFVLGPAMGGILGELDPTVAFQAASAVALVNFLYGLFLLPESLPLEHRKATRGLRQVNPLRSISDLFAVPATRFLVVTLMISSLANALTQCTWALYTEYRYGFGTLQIGLSVFALGLSIAFVQGFLLQRSLRRHAPESIARTVLAAGSLSLAVVALSPSGAAAAAAFCLFALAGAVAPLLTGAISRRTPINMQGTVIGSLSSLNSITGALAPAAATPLLMVTATHRADILAGAPYLTGALLMAAACVIFHTGCRRLKAIESKTSLPLDEDAQ